MLNKIENDFVDSLQRINFIFRNDSIFTECINNYTGFSVLGEKLGPFEKGKKYKLKFFLAVPFIKNNILKVALESKCDNVDLQRFAIEERDDQKLIQRDNEFFLNKIKEFHLFLEKDIMENNKPQKFLDDYKSYQTSVIDSRMLKVMRMAKSDLSIEVEKRLTASEHLLYNNIHKIVNIWRNFLLNLTKIKK